MNKLSHFFSQKETYLLLATIAALLFFWPLLTFKNMENPMTTWLFLYVSWAAVIAALFLMSRFKEEKKQD